MLTKKEVLSDLGYNIDLNDTKIVLDVMGEVIDCLNQYDEEDVKKIVYNKNSFVYVELAYFGYEIGIVNLHKRLNEYEDMRCKTIVNDNVKEEIFGEMDDSSIYDTIFLASKYINDKNSAKGERGKVIQKLQAVN